MPEIIRFSNDLCYTDVPLIPLRQPPPNRVRPLQFTFVDKGSCEGDGQRINNRAEAERIVEAINACLNDEAYEGKTMGVITLQGHAQAELIEKRLAEILEPKIREEHLCYTDVPLIPLRQPPPNRVRPLQFTFVDKGSCEGDGQRINNRAEAERIVEAINACLNDEAYEGKTMGVITLQGHAQAELIEKRLAEILEPKIREERKLRCGVPATFQGDQRDVIFLSLVVAPNHRFRSLTGLADQRRFNVAMSRARDQCWLFHSVQQHDLSREDFRWRLLNFFHSPGQGVLDELYEELARLEREAKRSPRRLGEQPDPYDSWFEVDVALELLRRKYKIRPQFEIAGYRIDLIVDGLGTQLAVECDGDAWHGPEAYERDMARQRQIARAGLTFVRIPESEFYADRTRSIQQVIEECDRLDIRPTDEFQETTSQGPTPTSPPLKTNAADGEDLAGQSNAETEREALSEEDLTAGSEPVRIYSEEGEFPHPLLALPLLPC